MNDWIHIHHDPNGTKFSTKKKCEKARLFHSYHYQKKGRGEKDSSRPWKESYVSWDTTQRNEIPFEAAKRSETQWIFEKLSFFWTRQLFIFDTTPHTTTTTTHTYLFAPFLTYHGEHGNGNGNENDITDSSIFFGFYFGKCSAAFLALPLHLYLLYIPPPFFFPTSSFAN